MKNGIIYRGSYPVFRIDKGRDETYTELVLDAGINCIINLADNETDIEALAGLAPWYNTLLLNNSVIGLDIQFDFDFLDKFEYEIFNYRLRQGFKFLIMHDGPYLIHCNADTDKTGFVAAIIELLFGASVDDVICDYLLSYGKEFADAKDEKLNFITGRNIYAQINAIVNGKINDSNNLQAYIETYFLERVSLTIKELEALKKINTIICLWRRKMQTIVLLSRENNEKATHVSVFLYNGYSEARQFCHFANHIPLTG